MEENGLSADQISASKRTTKKQIFSSSLFSFSYLFFFTIMTLFSVQELVDCVLF